MGPAGGECVFKDEQIEQIALTLEKCKSWFIWVLRGGWRYDDQWLVRFGDKGLVLTEWAPQVVILDQWAMEGFVMHCGWNSTLESICAGLPVIAWPLHSEQFINERLVVDVLRVGVRLLHGKMRSLDPDTKEVVDGEVIREAIDRLMGEGADEQVEEIWRNAKRYGELAKAAMEEGGLSDVNLSGVIEEMKAIVKKR